MTHTPPDDTPIEAPSACPFCRSLKIAPPPKKVSASTYWRCESCGQMWNVGRNIQPPAAVGGRWNSGR
jgi:ribosomal protein L37AE/L43A